MKKRRKRKRETRKEREGKGGKEREGKEREENITQPLLSIISTITIRFLMFKGIVRPQAVQYVVPLFGRATRGDGVGGAHVLSNSASQSQDQNQDSWSEKFPQPAHLWRCTNREPKKTKIERRTGATSSSDLRPKKVGFRCVFKIGTRSKPE